VKVGDLVRTTRRVTVGAQTTIMPSDIGLVLRVWDPTVQDPQGTVIVAYPRHRHVTLMWKELEVLSEGR